MADEAIDKIKVSELTKAAYVGTNAVAVGINEEGGETQRIPIGTRFSQVDNMLSLKADKSSVKLLQDAINGIGDSVQKIKTPVPSVMLTIDEYQQLNPPDPLMWYLVTNSAGDPRRIYLGSLLIAKARMLDNGSVGFEYTFPITF